VDNPAIDAAFKGIPTSFIPTSMKRVTGIGGVFFTASDPEALREWYNRHLGLEAGPYGMSFQWRHHEAPEQEGATAWSIFDKDTKYLDPTRRSYMINYRVADLPGLLKVLAEEGVEQVGDMQEFDYGRFAWILDGEGNKVELWEPKDEAYAKLLDAEEAKEGTPSGKLPSS
jgi:predicted enzyme related to lactoylglutathione lyase